MEILNLILNSGHMQTTCLLCFKKIVNNTHNIDDLIEIHSENLTIVETLRNIVKFLFSSFEIIYNQACGNCTNILLKMYFLMKKAVSKIQAIGNLIRRIHEDLTIAPQKSDLFINANEDLDISNKILQKKNVNCNKDLDFNQQYSIKQPTNENELNLHKTNKILCTVCGKYLRTLSSLNAHIKSHQIKQCPYCSKTLKNNSHYRIHLKNHKADTEKKYICHDCGHKTCNKTDLVSHMNKHHLKVKPHICSICRKGFYSQRNLNEHILIHKNEITLTCELCGVQFSCNTTLKNHLKLHSGSRMYRCDKCNNSFVTASRYNEHVKRKHGEKNFPCSVCEKKYSLKKTLNQHMKTIHSITNCNEE